MTSSATPAIFERVRGIEPPFPAWKAGALTIELHPLIKESTHSSETNPHPPLRRPYFVPRHCAWLFGRHGIYRKSSVLLSNTVMFPTYGVFFLDSFERHIRIELTSPAWQAGTLTIVLMPLILCSWVESNHRPLVYQTSALIRLSYTNIFNLMDDKNPSSF